MISRRRPRQADDQGVVAIELVLVMPFIIAMIVCVVALAGLYSTKSRVVGAARDGARALSLKAGVANPNADPNSSDGITVTLDSPACPPLSDPAYQSTTPPSVTAKATTTYTVSIPFVHTWSNIAVTERATMPCG
jgi:Flp pilus assembly protein TadG